MLRSMLLIALTSSVACTQPFIEISVSSTAINETSTEFHHLSFQAVFDASTPPLSDFGCFKRWEAVWSQVTDPALQPNNPVGNAVPSEDSVAYIWWVCPGRYVIDVYSFGVGQVASLEVTEATADFREDDYTLPSSLSDYQFSSDTPSPKMSLDLFKHGTIEWTPEAGFTNGVFTISVQHVENPNTPEPCVGDINGDGDLNFLDVSAFLQSFGNGCP